MDNQNQVKRFCPGSYALWFILFAVMITLIVGALLCWFKFITWSKVIPYTIETTIVADAKQASNNAEMKWFSFPFTLSQDIIVDSEDLDALYDRLEEHIDGYISFTITVLSIAFASFGIVVPLYNYFFLQKDIVEGVQKYADKLKKKTDSFTKELKSKKQEYEKAVDRIKALSEGVKKAQKDLNRAQRDIENLQIDFNKLMGKNNGLSDDGEKMGIKIEENKEISEEDIGEETVVSNSLDATANPEPEDMKFGGKA